MLVLQSLGLYVELLWTCYAVSENQIQKEQ